MALPRQPVTTLTPQSVDRDRQLAQLLFGQAQRTQPEGPGALIGGLAQALAGQRAFQRASAGEEQLRQQQRDQLADVLARIPGIESVGGVSLADALSSPNPALQNVGGALLQSQLAQPEDTSAIRNFQFAQDNPEFAEFLRTSDSPLVNFEAGALAPTTATTNQLQRETLNAQETLLRLDDIATSFDPTFLELPTQLGQEINAFRDRLGSVTEIFGIPELTVEQKQRLADYTTFATRTLNNMNITLNRLSGAAVNEQEFKRIQGALPNADDSPTEFQAKMNNAIRDMRRSLARLNIAQREGLNPLNSGITLEGVDARINAEDQRLRQALEGQGLTPGQINEIVDRELRMMFFGESL